MSARYAVHLGERVYSFDTHTSSMVFRARCRDPQWPVCVVDWHSSWHTKVSKHLFPEEIMQIQAERRRRYLVTISHDQPWADRVIL